MDNIEKLIIKIFKSSKEKAGYRTIKMTLQRDYGIKVNHKKIRRIQKEQGLKTKVRMRKRFNSYTEESRRRKAFPDLLKRNFKQAHPNSAHSADITEVIYKGGRKAYIFAAKDLYCKSIFTYSISSSPNSDFVTKRYYQKLRGLPKEELNRLICHTDRGGQFFSDPFVGMLKNMGVKQSMSRKGNCLDNSPIESFFGHMKDEVEFKDCRSLEDVIWTVNKYMKKYNVNRPQWGLKGKTPDEYRGQ